MEELRKYGVGCDIYFPLVKVASMNFALGADFTHAAGDTKISKNGGAAANTTNAPAAIAMGNAAIWKLTLTATEMQAALIVITVSDAATKVIEDQAILISTYGDASAQHAFDLATATQNVNVSTITTGAITAAAIATDAIGAAELAADAVAEIADAVWDEIASGHVAAGSFGQIFPLRGSTAQAGAAGTITLDASASATDDLYKGNIIAVTSGTGVGQARLITAYVGATKVASVSPNWITNPSSSSVFVILPFAYVAGLVSALTGAITSGSFASGAIDATALAADAIGSSELAATATAEISQAVWDALTSALTTAGSAGKLLVDNLNTTVSSRASQTSVDTVDDFLDTEVAAIKAKTDNLPAAPAAVSDIPTAAAIADAVLDDALTEPAATFTWAGATLRTVVAWLGALARNRILQTNTLSTLRNDANSSDLSTSTVSDDGSVFVRGEWT